MFFQEFPIEKVGMNIRDHNWTMTINFACTVLGCSHQGNNICSHMHTYGTHLEVK